MSARAHGSLDALWILPAATTRHLRSTLALALAATAALVSARTGPPSAQVQQYLEVMTAQNNLGGCQECDCNFCCLQSCDSRCGDPSNCGSGCYYCVCTIGGWCVAGARGLKEDALAQGSRRPPPWFLPSFSLERSTSSGYVQAQDFCFPKVYSVIMNTWSAEVFRDSVARVIRHDGNVGMEREDFIDQQFGAGDIRRGYIIRDLNKKMQYNVTEDADGHVTGCQIQPLVAPMPDCVANGAEYEGEGLLGANIPVSFYRAITSPHSRTDIVVSKNDSSLLRTAVVDAGGFIVTDFLNFNTNAIPSNTFTPPSGCSK